MAFDYLSAIVIVVGGGFVMYKLYEQATAKPESEEKSKKDLEDRLKKLEDGLVIKEDEK